MGIDEDDEAPIQLQTSAGLFAAEMEAMGIGTDRPAVVRPCCEPLSGTLPNWLSCKALLKRRVAAVAPTWCPMQVYPLQWLRVAA